MGLSSTLANLLLFFRLCGICRGFEQGNCTDYKLQFDRVFSVPGDVAMLNSTLVSPDVFDFKTVPYTITWYNSSSGQVITSQTGHILVKQETLWFLNATLGDGGDYVTILRTPSRCYRQATQLVVEERPRGECGRPRKVFQSLTKGVTDSLNCPLRDQIDTLKSYNITSSIKWYRDCDPIVDGTDSYEYWDTRLTITHVEVRHEGAYTCTLTFTLGGIKGSVSESIDADVRGEFSLIPEVHEPTNEVIKARRGFSFSKRCLVFVAGEGKPSLDIYWLARGEFIDMNTSHRVYMLEQRLVSMLPNKGSWSERLLMFAELQEEDFYTNYTCRVYSDRGFPEGYFSLQPADSNIILGCVLGGVMVLFMITVIVCYCFKIRGVL